MAQLILIGNEIFLSRRIAPRPSERWKDRSWIDCHP